MIKRKLKLLTDIALGLVNLIYKYSDQLPPGFLEEVCNLSNEFKAKMNIVLLGETESED